MQCSVDIPTEIYALEIICLYLWGYRKMVLKRALHKYTFSLGILERKATVWLLTQTPLILPVPEASYNQLNL